MRKRGQSNSKDRVGTIPFLTTLWSLVDELTENPAQEAIRGRRLRNYASLATLSLVLGRSVPGLSGVSNEEPDSLGRDHYEKNSGENRKG